MRGNGRDEGEIKLKDPIYDGIISNSIDPAGKKKNVKTNDEISQ